MRVLITGATGWLGHAALQAIKNELPEVESKDLELFASHERYHLDPSFGLVKINTFTSSAFTPKKIDLFIGLALKTRDHSMVMDEKEYLDSNKTLIAKHIELIRSTNPKKIILISSGVVSKYLEGNSLLDQYTSIKLLEEKRFDEVAKQINSKLITLRLWGATGELMTEPLKYAIGNLIYQAEKTNQIVINSRNKVFRRYVDATQIFEVLIRAFEQNYCGTLNSGGITVEIESLAKLIAKNYKKHLKIVRELEAGMKPDLYIPTDSEFDNLANSVGVSLRHMDEQIAFTTKSVKRAMEK